MKLHGSLTSPYVRKARVALLEAGVPFEFVACDVWTDTAFVQSMNPLGKVPVLETDEGDPIFDSSAIIDFADTMSGGRLVPGDPAPRRSVLRWHALGHGIIDAAVVQVLESRRPAPLQSAAQIEHERGRLGRALDAANAGVGDAEHLVGSRLTLADLTLAVALLYIEFRLDFDWRRDRRPLADWLSRIHRRPSLVLTAPPRQ